MELTLSTALFSASFFTFSAAMGLPVALLLTGRLEETFDSCLIEIGFVIDTLG